MVRQRISYNGWGVFSVINFIINFHNFINYTVNVVLALQYFVNQTTGGIAVDLVPFIDSACGRTILAASLVAASVIDVSIHFSNLPRVFIAAIPIRHDRSTIHEGLQSDAHDSPLFLYGTSTEACMLRHGTAEEKMF